VCIYGTKKLVCFELKVKDEKNKRNIDNSFGAMV
jgi:hypothetical protein